MNQRLQKLINPAIVAEFLFFIFAQYSGVIVGVQYLTQNQNSFVEQDTVSTSLYFLLTFVLVTLGVFYFLKKVKKRGYVMNVFFYLAIFQGLYYYLQAFLNPLQALIGTLMLIGILLIHNSILVHDVVLLLALIGIGVILGGQFSLATATVIVSTLLIYDAIAVYKTKHMVTMFTKMVSQKVYFALILPFNVRDYKNKVSLLDTDNNYLFLGTGDIVVPMIFLIPSSFVDISLTWASLWGAVGGLLILYLVAYFTPQRRAHAGLPFIVGGMLISAVLYLL